MRDKYRTKSGRRRRKGPLRILKHNIKRTLLRHPWLVPAILITVIVLGGASYWMFKSVRSQTSRSLSAKAQFNAGSGYRDIVYKGKKYRYNNRITTILYAGVDSDGPLQSSQRYTVAPRADSISLVVLDELNERMTILALNRDTMTRIHKFTLDGFDRGLFKDHLGYAYTDGDGGDISCRSLCEAVSELLYGVPINEYVVTNRASIPTIAEVFGDVSVVVPNDDLAEEGFHAGETVVIDSSNLELFVRSRDIEQDLSNVGRMQRQQAYINGAVEQVRDMLINHASSVWDRLQQAEDSVQTNITRSRYLTLTKAVRNTAYSDQDYYIPEGEQVVGEQHDEFYPDERTLLKKVIDIFYIEK